MAQLILLTEIFYKTVQISCVDALSLFVVEARRSDGNPYPANTIYMYYLLAGILHYKVSDD